MVKAKVTVKKKTVKAKPVKKAIAKKPVKKTTAKKIVAKPVKKVVVAKKVSTTKRISVKKHGSSLAVRRRVQTAHGWKRVMLKKKI